MQANRVVPRSCHVPAEYVSAGFFIDAVKIE